LDFSDAPADTFCLRFGFCCAFTWVLLLLLLLLLLFAIGRPLLSGFGILKRAALKLDTSVMSFLDEAGDCDAGESAVALPSELGRNFRRRASMGSSCFEFEFELVEDGEAEDAGFRSV
jgi:hypothetical protein